MDAKLDQIDGKIDGHGERIVALETRSTHTEKDVLDIQTTMASGQLHRSNGRQLITASLTSAGAGGLISAIITWLAAHH